ncbi:MAG: acetyl-CoA carboxylase biotin carboxyl carrier protein [Candidatus Acidiferrales bacterium]|jgi:acetyl-CoA carboxylase biotin carboxyl carrier protein
MAKKAKAGTNGQTEIRGVDLAEVERLLGFMEKHGLEEFEYEHAGVRIRLKKASARPAGTYQQAPVSETLAHPPQSHAASPPAHAGGREHGAGAASDLHIIKSPIVGTFYAAPSPGADPFVTEGARVEQGQVLCIIEAMKLMNEIESDVAGELARVFVENGHPVEYGEALFGIRPKGKK